jgi:hypothetical protein
MEKKDMHEMCAYLRRFTWLSVLVFGLVCIAPAAPPVNSADFVVIGDSLASGFQNFSLVDAQQVHSFANVISQQWGKPLVLPLVPCPGFPNVLQLEPPFTFPPNIVPNPGTLVFPRENATVQATNLAVPGQTLADAIGRLPGNFGSPIDALTSIVLGFPDPLLSATNSRSQVEWALALQPKTLLVWIGNNDALLAAMTGFAPITDTTSFDNSYKQMMDTLRGGTTASIVTANIPDVTQAPFFTPVQTLASQIGKPVADVAAALGVSQSDFLRAGALARAIQILSNPAQSNFHDDGLCPDATGLTGPGGKTPCVLTSGDAATIRNAIVSFNDSIADASVSHGATLVDMNTFFADIFKNGYQVGGNRLTVNYLGGLVSLDGVHPTNTLHAIIANEFIRVMNTKLHTGIPPVAVVQVAKTDPLISPAAALTSHVCQ